MNEALANVTKQAAATRAWVRLAQGDGPLAVEVGDDGRGIVSQVPQIPSSHDVITDTPASSTASRTDMSAETR